MATPSSPWGPPELLDHSNRRTDFIIVVMVFTVVSTVFVFARIYTRAFIVRSMGGDDYTIIAGLICLWASSLSSVFYMNLGKIGYHTWDVPPDPAATMAMQKMQLVNQLLYNPVLTFTKISLLLFYLRLSPSGTFHIWTWATVWFTIALGISTFICDLIQCLPVAFYWDRTIPGGKCFNNIAFYFASAGLSIATDLWILILPMPAFWGLQISLKRRLVLISLFGLGLVVVIMSALRLFTLHRLFFKTNDPLYDDAVIWSNMELTLAVVCACIPSLRPLLSHFFPGTFGSVGATNYKTGGQGYIAEGSRGTRRRGTNHSYSLEEMGAKVKPVGSVYESGTSKRSNDSEEMIIGKNASDMTTRPERTYPGAAE